MSGQQQDTQASVPAWVTPTPGVPAAATATTDAVPAEAATTTSTTQPKLIQTLVLDTGPIIKNDPNVNTLREQAEELYTIPAVISEIRDAATRSRVETTLLPFVKLRNPKPESIKFVSDFARRTGDLEVLSRPDLHLVALTYELECENNGGDWRLRKTPNQQGLNGKSPAKLAEEKAAKETAQEKVAEKTDEAAAPEATEAKEKTEEEAKEKTEETEAKAPETVAEPAEAPTEAETSEITQKVDDLALEKEEDAPEETDEDEDEDDDDGGEWITPSNLKKHQAKDTTGGAPTKPIQHRLQAALLTSDFAMQNVALRINLNLLSPTNMHRVNHVKNWLQRCYGCFEKTFNMKRQFCARCGQPTLTRVSYTINTEGKLVLGLKKNFQINKRGNVFSVPKAVHGSASGKMTDRSGRGGKDGWGRDLILSEDQSEYTKKMDIKQRQVKYKDMMDEDYLPGLLTGVRGAAANKVQVGAGRNVNSKKR